MGDLKVYESEAFRVEKPPELLEINPNGKMPAVRHHTFDSNGKPLKVDMFESCAIIHYMLDQFDVENKLRNPNDKNFMAKLYQFSHYFSGTVDNLSAISLLQ